MSASEIWFYHLERSSLEKTLPPLLERCLARGWRAIVRGGEAARLAALDEAIWTFRDESFIPHAIAAGEAAARQPVLLTAAPGNPNGAQALFVIDGAALDDHADFTRTCFLFDGADADALAAARAQWKALKQKGAAISYWRESGDGKWEKQA